VSGQVSPGNECGKIFFTCPCSSVDRASASGAESESSSLSRGASIKLTAFRRFLVFSQPSIPRFQPRTRNSAQEDHLQLHQFPWITIAGCPSSFSLRLSLPCLFPPAVWIYHYRPLERPLPSLLRRRCRQPHCRLQQRPPRPPPRRQQLPLTKAPLLRR
jgi:hypothetical protein